MAVSYTHLDVYKRQVHEGVAFAGEGARKARGAVHGLKGRLDEQRARAAAGVIGVSYTHLHQERKIQRRLQRKPSGRGQTGGRPASGDGSGEAQGYKMRLQADLMPGSACPRS